MIVDSTQNAAPMKEFCNANLRNKKRSRREMEESATGNEEGKEEESMFNQGPNIKQGRNGQRA